MSDTNTKDSDEKTMDSVTFRFLSEMGLNPFRIKDPMDEIMSSTKAKHDEERKKADRRFKKEMDKERKDPAPKREPLKQPARIVKKAYPRNKPCHCESGIKYKMCCGKS